MTARPIPESSPQRHRDPPPDENSERGRTTSYQSVGSYRDYADAERAVDRLSDGGFPVETVAIVGRGLRTVEQVTGRRTYWTTAGQYAVSGALIGALIGWFLGLFDLVDPLVAAIWLALWGALFGAVLGALAGVFAHLATGGRRDFSSVGTVRADSYDLQVDSRYAREAARLLYSAEDAESQPRPAPPPDPTDQHAGPDTPQR